MESDEVYVSELEKFLSQAQHPKTVDLLKKALDKSKQDIVSHQPAPAQAVRAKPKTDKPSTYFVAIDTYGWDQSTKFVKIYVSSVPGLVGITEENVTATFGDKSFVLQIINSNGKGYSLEIHHLLKSIIPESSNVKLKNDMVVLNLCKKAQEKWSHLTTQEKKLTDAKDTKPKYDPEKDPNEGIMDLMRKMYNEGDDDMKRTIAKAWTESQEKRSKGLDGF